MPHDFKNFPELTNRQMQVYYFQSPHKQITENFRARVVKVTDGDTIRVVWDERNFSFPIRIVNLAAPEMDERGGKESQSWLEHLIFGKDVDVIVSKERVEKWGRLLADVMTAGILISEESVRAGRGVAWEERGLSIIPNFDLTLEAAAI